MNNLHITQPHFVRCLIPNESKLGGVIDAKLVLQQLQCNGILEGIRMCRKGFPVRVTHSDFLQRYSVLKSRDLNGEGMNEDSKSKCVTVLNDLQMDEEIYTVGESKVLFKNGVVGRLEELRDVALEEKILVIQCYLRKYLAQFEYMKMSSKKIALSVLQANLRLYAEIKSWSWWKLHLNIIPLLELQRQEVSILTLCYQYKFME